MTGRTENPEQHCFRAACDWHPYDACNDLKNQLSECPLLDAIAYQSIVSTPGLVYLKEGKIVRSMNTSVNPKFSYGCLVLSFHTHLTSALFSGKGLTSPKWKKTGDVPFEYQQGVGAFEKHCQTEACSCQLVALSLPVGNIMCPLQDDV